jgi:hypothetical protein
LPEIDLAGIAAGQIARGFASVIATVRDTAAIRV